MPNVPARICLGLAALFFSLTAWAQPLDDVYKRGLALAKAKDFAAAAPLFRQAAEAGHPAAQAAMGQLASFGDGVPQSKQEARRWYELAAAQGDPMSLYNIGLYWDRGIGGPQDRARALDYYRKGAAAGEDRAAYNAGQILFVGDGVPPDAAEGTRLIAIAAAKGNTVAQVSLGYIYENGIGVRKDARRAMDLYALAEKAGHPKASERLLRLANIVLEEGLALERDRKGQAALEMQDLACHYGQFYACYNAGRLHVTGEIVPKNLNAALIRFHKACKWDNAPGCRAISDTVLTGQSTAPADVAVALKIMQTQCGQGNASGCHNLAVLKLRPEYNMLDQQGAMKLLAQNCFNKGFQKSCQPYMDIYNASLPKTSGGGSSSGGMTALEQGIIDVLGIVAGTMQAMGSAGQYSAGSYSGYSSAAPPGSSSSVSGGYSPQDRADFNQFISSVSAYGQNIKCRAGNPYC